MAEAARPGWVVAWLERGCAPEAALARFDGLAPVAPEEMRGSWRGRSLPTGHPLDGVLEGLGWWGKTFETNDRVHPLLFRIGTRFVAVEPALMPAGLGLGMPALARNRAAQAAARAVLRAATPMLRARRPGARLERRVMRGRESAAMVYLRQPIVDHLRAIGPDRVLGLMERRGMARPYFFLLERRPASPGSMAT